MLNGKLSLSARAAITSYPGVVECQKVLASKFAAAVVRQILPTRSISSTCCAVHTRPQYGVLPQEKHRDRGRHSLHQNPPIPLHHQHLLLLVPLTRLLYCPSSFQGGTLHLQVSSSCSYTSSSALFSQSRHAPRHHSSPILVLCYGELGELYQQPCLVATEPSAALRTLMFIMVH